MIRIFRLFMLVALLSGCAHRSVSLAEIEAVNPGREPSATTHHDPKNNFEWRWQSAETEAEAIGRFLHWLIDQPSGVGTLCLVLAENDERVEQLVEGWQHARRLQNIAQAEQVVLNLDVCGSAAEPRLMAALESEYGQ